MDKKSILIGALGVSLLFVSIGAGTQQEQATNTTVPESHVWELYVAREEASKDRVYSLNKVTGEVRKYSKKGMQNGKLKDQYYQVLTEDK